jgi:hypothetical protein
MRILRQRRQTDVRSLIARRKMQLVFLKRPDMAAHRHSLAIVIADLNQQIAAHPGLAELQKPGAPSIAARLEKQALEMMHFCEAPIAPPQAPSAKRPGWLNSQF